MAIHVSILCLWKDYSHILIFLGRVLDRSLKWVIIKHTHLFSPNGTQCRRKWHSLLLYYLNISCGWDCATSSACVTSSPYKSCKGAKPKLISAFWFQISTAMQNTSLHGSYSQKPTTWTLGMGRIAAGVILTIVDPHWLGDCIPPPGWYSFTLST